MLEFLIIVAIGGIIFSSLLGIAGLTTLLLYLALKDKR